MRSLLGCLAAVVLALGAGCGDDTEGEKGAEPASGHAGTPTGTLFLGDIREGSITRVDLGNGESTTVAVPELAPGDPPFHLVGTGGRLVFYGGSHTYALGLDLEGPPFDLGESWYFVPSGRDGRVWLTTLDPESPETVRDLKAVRETTVRGEITVGESGRPPSRGPSILAAVADGLLIQAGDELSVWDPISGEVTARLPGAFPADTHENLVAWCGRGCPELHVTDLETDGDLVIQSGSFRFEETYDGAFSPDGRYLALPVAVGPRSHLEGHSHAVGLVDVAAGTAGLLEGSEPLGDNAALTWSASGDWLYFVAGDAAIKAHGIASGETVVLPVRAPAGLSDIVAG